MTTRMGGNPLLPRSSFDREALRQEQARWNEALQPKKMVVPPLTPATMKMDGKYNWKNQPERLIYLGRNWSGNGYWHQFKKIGDSREVWCEVLDSDLHMLEETKESTQ